jgi:integrase
VFHKVKVPKRAAAKRQPITDAQKDLIMRTWRGHRMGVPALLLLFTGMRRGELVALTWRDIDLKNRTVSVTKAAAFNGNQPEIKEPKTPAGVRTIPFPDQLVPILAEAKRSANSLYVCPDAHGGIMSDRGWLTSWNSYQHYLNIEAGGKDRSRTNPKIVAIEPFTAHQLRHTYATMLYDAGVDVKTAQEFLGHADLTVTMNIYTHLSPQKRDAALQALDSHFAQSLPQVL